MALGPIKPVVVPDPPATGGTVTSLAWQKKDPSRCSVFIDGVFAFGLHVDVIVAHGVQNGKMLSVDACTVLLQDDVYHRALKRILSFLAYKPRTVKEIQDRLVRMQVALSTREQVMDKVRAMHLVNDERYAEEFARGRLRAYGPRRVVHELLQKGIPAALAEKMVAECNPHEDPDEHMARVVAKAYARYRTEENQRLRSQKTLRYLIGRGYELEPIQSALTRIAG